MNYRMCPTTEGRIIKETCGVISDTLVLKGYLKATTSKNDWKTTANYFEKRWNFRNCFGAIDGKQIVIQIPQRAGLMHYNYKGTHSVELRAVINATYQFILVDIGDVGGQSDGGVFSASI